MRCGINSLLGIIESSMGLNATEETVLLSEMA